MAVRDFTDSRGRAWLAWDVTPDELNPRTQDEDFLAKLYHTGWLVFETQAGDEKRRLYPIPKDWRELPDPGLEVLLQKAEVVPKRKLRSEKQATGPSAAKAVQRATEPLEQSVHDPKLARAFLLCDQVDARVAPSPIKNNCFRIVGAAAGHHYDLGQHDALQPLANQCP